MGWPLPGTGIAGFRARAARVAAAGIFNLGIHYEHVVMPLLRALDVLAMAGLGPAGQQAQERIGLYAEQLRTQAARARDVYARMSASAMHR
ncbi:hypothetical protein [Streptomyces sp. NPDC001851]|uniref:hypothetical protein n=1 Tax=Streptomyces sp. NPDC001851 TaxID=3154529 RepID=UPI003321B9F5